MSTPAAGLGPIGVVAHFNLLERLEPSGPGELFRARDTHHGRTVVLRWLPGDGAPSQSGRDDIVARAKAMTVLSHPNVITLFDAGVADGRAYLAFEHLQGQSLRKEMAGGHLSVRRAVQTGVQVADAIAAAHALGFVHGGLSPDSISITARGHAKVPAYELAAHGGFSADGSLHDYHAPEELAGQVPDDRSDVYSVGAILYEMLTGRRPNPKGSARPSDTNRHVPKELDDLTLRAVSPHPDHRPPTMALLAAELRTVLAQLELLGSADEPEHHAHRLPSRRGPVLVAVGVVAAAAALWWFVSGAP